MGFRQPSVARRSQRSDFDDDLMTAPPDYAIPAPYQRRDYRDDEDNIGNTAETVDLHQFVKTKTDRYVVFV
ncbi:MAG: hypothetical protein ACK56I_06765, partial [bacterium]